MNYRTSRDPIAINGRAYQTGWDDGIREGERRMLWAIAVGAELDRVRFSAFWESQHWLGRNLQAFVACQGALHALRDLGDEDASRVLGERGW